MIVWKVGGGKPGALSLVSGRLLLVLVVDEDSAVVPDETEVGNEGADPILAKESNELGDEIGFGDIPVTGSGGG